MLVEGDREESFRASACRDSMWVCTQLPVLEKHVSLRTCSYMYLMMTSSLSAPDKTTSGGGDGDFQGLAPLRLELALGSGLWFACERRSPCGDDQLVVVLKRPFPVCHT